ncbi:hypothetical protein HDU93_000411 [Gonapodya sp. JEL0774]|nr:hypothetical protein HDU93_000411 [Gonapodya sp. JEL0774]
MLSATGPIAPFTAQSPDGDGDVEMAEADSDAREVTGAGDAAGASLGSAADMKPRASVDGEAKEPRRRFLGGTAGGSSSSSSFAGKQSRRRARPPPLSLPAQRPHSVAVSHSSDQPWFASAPASAQTGASATATTALSSCSASALPPLPPFSFNSVSGGASAPPSSSASSPSASSPAQPQPRRILNPSLHRNSWHGQGSAKQHASSSSSSVASPSSADAHAQARPPSLASSLSSLSSFSALSALASSAASSLLNASFSFRRNSHAHQPPLAPPALPSPGPPDSPSSLSAPSPYPQSSSAAPDPRRLSVGSFDSILYSPVPRPVTHQHTIGCPAPPSPTGSPFPLTLPPSVLSSPTNNLTNSSARPPRSQHPSPASYPPHELLQKIISYLPPPDSTPLSLISTNPPAPGHLFSLTLVNSAWYYAAAEALWRDPHWRDIGAFEKWVSGVEWARRGVKEGRAMTARTGRVVGMVPGLGAMVEVNGGKGGSLGLVHSGEALASVPAVNKNLPIAKGKGKPKSNGQFGLVSSVSSSYVTHSSILSAVVEGEPTSAPVRPRSRASGSGREKGKEKVQAPSPYGRSGPALLRRVCFRRTPHLVEYIRDDHMARLSGAFGGVREVDMSGPTLRYLDVSGCRRVTDHGLAAVVRGVCAAGRLRELRASGLARVTRAALKGACERLSIGCPELMSLEFSIPAPPATQRDHTYYSMPVRAMSNIAEISLRECGGGVTDAVVKTLADACGDGMKGIALRGATALTTAGVESLLSACPGLCKIDFRGCRRVDDLTILALALSSCAENLVSLDLGSTLITDGSLYALEVGVGPRPGSDPVRVAKAASCAFPKLQKLGLSDLDRVSFEGIFAVARHLAPVIWAPDWSVSRGGVLEEVDVSGIPDLDPRRAAAIYAQGVPLPVQPLAGWPPNPAPVNVGQVPGGQVGAGGGNWAVANAMLPIAQFVQNAVGAGTVTANVAGLVQRPSRPTEEWIEGLLDVPERVGSARGEYRWWCALKGEKWKRVVQEAWARKVRRV